MEPNISVDTVKLPAISMTATTLSTCNTTKLDATITPTVCGSCFHPINDPYIMKVVDAFYHEHCLECCVCSKRLLHSCFARSGKMYCRFDYER